MASARFAISPALQELMEIIFETSEQQKDTGATRIERDFNDVEKVVHFLLDLFAFHSEATTQEYNKWRNRE